MASKGKRAKLKVESSYGVIFWAAVAVFLGYLQNRWGQFSDIRGFYGMRFMDGLHHWPFDTYIPAGATDPLHPVEYPAITGLVIWLLAVITPNHGIPILNYFQINVFVNALLFVASAYFVKKLGNRNSGYLYLAAPAVIMSLNLNWDIWAILPMLGGIYYFEKNKYTESSILLAIGTATKFFPVVLLFPISIYFLRIRQLRSLVRYVVIFVGSWLAINLPFMLTTPSGWAYFYQFSYRRGLGSASFYEIFSALGIKISFSNGIYYALNLGVFTLLALFLFKSKTPINLATSSFFALFAFILFGKQYSMQYVMWLAPLAAIVIAKVKGKTTTLLLGGYAIWQAFEWAFHYAFFQHMLTNDAISRGIDISNAVSTHTYGTISALRYVFATGFAIYLAKKVYKSDTANKG